MGDSSARRIIVARAFMLWRKCKSLSGSSRGARRDAYSGEVSEAMGHRLCLADQRRAMWLRVRGIDAVGKFNRLLHIAYKLGLLLRKAFGAFKPGEKWDAKAVSMVGFADNRRPDHRNSIGFGVCARRRHRQGRTVYCRLLRPDVLYDRTSPDCYVSQTRSIDTICGSGLTIVGPSK